MMAVAGLTFGCGGEEPRSEDPKGLELVAKPNELPTCDDSNAMHLIYVSSERKFMQCVDSRWEEIQFGNADNTPGPKGDPGPAGPQGEPAKPFGFGLFDAAGQLVGYPDTPTISPEADRYVMFADGHIGQLRPSTGEILLGDSSCYYQVTDCAGACFSVHGPNDPLGNHLLERVADRHLMVVPTDAANEGEFYYLSRWSGGSCENIRGFAPQRFRTDEWKPASIALPLKLPLRVQLLR
jgi:hypothetical protein